MAEPIATRTEDPIVAPTDPSQADIDDAIAERDYLGDQILQSDVYIARMTSALEMSQYHLAEDYGGTLRGRELRALKADYQHQAAMRSAQSSKRCPAGSRCGG
ncbi:hypothetical protein [Flaviflexus equikiangi]|uniref:hypothetical protein n=1 Tax=Flaviflexus equikiangi TaxID=2758573 RepID=UPI0015F67113|nr:hypothetical protein [Flaviflexus equikiangi]